MYNYSGQKIENRSWGEMVELSMTITSKARVRNESNSRKGVGKTERDHKSGAWSRRMTNQLQRANWSNGVNKDFPGFTCRGKGNSSKAKKH